MVHQKKCLFDRITSQILNKKQCFQTPNAAIADNTTLNSQVSATRKMHTLLAKPMTLLRKGKSHWGEMPERSPDRFRRVVESMPQAQYGAKGKNMSTIMQVKFDLLRR